MKAEIKSESSFFWKRLLALCLAVLTAGCAWGCGSGDSGDPAAVLAETEEWLAEKVTEPAPGSVGGEWTVIALSRAADESGGSGADEDWRSEYLAAADDYVKAAGGVLHSRGGYEYTEYARMILGVTAAGGDPRSVGGYNLLEALTDMDDVLRQGTNGPVWTLIAYDCGGYEIPASDAPKQGQTSREALIRAILDLQQEDGGWSLSGGASDPDMTAMALTALAPYKTGKGGRPEEVSEETLAAAAEAAEKGIECLSALQQEDGGYASMDSDASESCSQAVTALSSLGIDCAGDERFIKGETSLLDALLSYRAENGGFCHSAADEEADLMASEQACYALAAYVRFQNGGNALFDMTDKGTR